MIACRMLDASVVLPDGRSLAYTDCGPNDGPLVFYFHGAPMSRLDLVGQETTFDVLGVRVVSPDRPGYGGSTPQPQRMMEDWPADVAALADHLDTERFAVLGMSSGGPYAVACAALLPGRVVSAAVVAGVTDMSWHAAWQGFTNDEATIMKLGSEEAAVRWCEEHFGRDGSGFLEDRAEASGLLATFSEAFRQGVGGYAQDVMVQAKPWAFPFAAITVPVRVLHGDADMIVPIAHGQHTAALIPGATLETFPEHGHLSIMDEIPQLAADLAGWLQ